MNWQFECLIALMGLSFLCTLAKIIECATKRKFKIAPDPVSANVEQFHPKPMDLRLIPHLKEHDPLHRKENYEQLLTYCKLSEFTLPNASAYTSVILRLTQTFPAHEVFHEISEKMEMITRIMVELGFMNSKARESSIQSKKEEVKRLILHTQTLIQQLYELRILKLFKFISKGLQADYHALTKKGVPSKTALLEFIQGVSEYWTLKEKYHYDLNQFCRLNHFQEELEKFLTRLDPDHTSLKKHKRIAATALNPSLPVVDTALATCLQQNLVIDHYFTAVFYKQLPLISKILEKSLETLTHALAKGEPVNLDQHHQVLRKFIESTTTIPVHFSRQLQEAQEKRLELFAQLASSVDQLAKVEQFQHSPYHPRLERQAPQST